MPLADAAGATGAGLLIALVVAVAAYFMPTIVALVRHSTNTAPTVVVNLFLGWTFIGWVVALAMAFTGKPHTPSGDAAPYYAAPPPAPWGPPGGPVVSPDGRYYWSGSTWLPVGSGQPPSGASASEGWPGPGTR